MLACLPLACSGPPGVPASEAVPEPTSALRPLDVRGPIPESARVVDYLIDARLDADVHTIEGTVTLTWRNRTRRTVDFMPFHLYMNAFRASDTRWMSAARGSFRGDELGDDAWGYVDVRSVKSVETDGVEDLERGAGPTTTLAWRELEDPSLMIVELPEPIGPGGSVTLEIDFLTQLPRVFARTGYADDFHMAGQWFPKPGVLEEAAGWKAHEFTAWSEFYADFGNYEVHLDVPARMVVGATGILKESREVEDRRHLTYEATMVHDFAWVADPDLVEHWGTYEDIRIRQLLAPEYAQDAEVHMDAQRWTLASMERRFGPYPWSTITIVHPPRKASGAGGMEYPTLYTTGARATRPGAPPAWLLEERFSGVFVTVHEFGHQFFQGLVASNEHDQPWLDEGVNTFANYLAYEDAYGENPWIARIAGQPVTLRDFGRIANATPADYEEIDKPASDFDANGSGYGSTAYSKAAAVLYTLRQIVGAERFDPAMRAYVDKTRFGHPKGKDLEMALRAGIGDRVVLAQEDGVDTVFDLPDFFDQALRSTRTIDFSVGPINIQRAIVKDGYYRHEHDGERTLHRHYPPLAEHTPPDGADDDGETDADGGDGGATGAGTNKAAPISTLPDEAIESRVKILRERDFQVPVEIRVDFERGDPALVVWDGRARSTTLTFPGQRIQQVTLDPSDKLMLERRRMNNVRIRAGQRDDDDGLGDPIGRVIEGVATTLLTGGWL